MYIDITLPYVFNKTRKAVNAMGVHTIDTVVGENIGALLGLYVGTTMFKQNLVKQVLHLRSGNQHHIANINN